MTSKIPIDLTCWYLNTRRVLELVGGPQLYSQLEGAKRLDGHVRKIAEQQITKNAITQWLRVSNPPTLGKLLLEKPLQEGHFFTHYSNFHFRGLSSIESAIRAGKPVPMATAYSKLPDGGRVQFVFHHEHLTSSSAWSELSGQKRLLVLGAIKNVKDGTIEAIPYAIANLAAGLSEPGYRGQYWHQHLEVHVDSIDSFGRVRQLARRAPKKTDLDLLRNIPEEDVKHAIADIIGEPTVPKDWGGERSDLFTSRLEVDGKRISAAIAFKGPAQFKPMTLAELGKNGDQIDRLFSEPAELLVLQHCHEVTPPIRSAMRAYAQQMGNPRLYCVIDGYDTVRILQAYGKCGLSQPKPRKTPMAKRAPAPRRT